MGHLSARLGGMPSGTFDAEDLIDAVDHVLGAGEPFDAGVLVDGRRAAVDAVELARFLRGAAGRVVLDVPDAGPVTVRTGSRTKALEADRG